MFSGFLFFVQMRSWHPISGVLSDATKRVNTPASPLQPCHCLVTVHYVEVSLYVYLPTGCMDMHFHPSSSFDVDR